MTTPASRWISPFVAQRVEPVIGVDPGECTGEVSEDVVLAFEDDTSGPVNASCETFAGLESGSAQFRGGNGDLVLGADRRRPTPTFLYVRHERKGIRVYGRTQHEQGSDERRRTKVTRFEQGGTRNGASASSRGCSRPCARWRTRARPTLRAIVRGRATPRAQARGCCDTPRSATAHPASRRPRSRSPCPRPVPRSGPRTGCRIR